MKLSASLRIFHRWLFRSVAQVVVLRYQTQRLMLLVYLQGSWLAPALLPKCVPNLLSAFMLVMICPISLLTPVKGKLASLPKPGAASSLFIWKSDIFVCTVCKGQYRLTGLHQKWSFGTLVTTVGSSQNEAPLLYGALQIWLPLLRGSFLEHRRLGARSS